LANSGLGASQQQPFAAPLCRRACLPTQCARSSEAILDFGEPLFSQLDPALPLDAVQSIFKIVITVSNAHVMSMPRWG
jgi:hypothetical protein